jgi:hypothetical protein
MMLRRSSIIFLCLLASIIPAVDALGPHCTAPKAEALLANLQLSVNTYNLGVYQIVTDHEVGWVKVSSSHNRNGPGADWLSAERGHCKQ